MLYQPAFGDACATLRELAMRQDDAHCDSGFVFGAYAVPTALADRPLYVLLKVFGKQLPARAAHITHITSETGRHTASWQPLIPTETNAYLLDRLLRVQVRWVDSLARHLDYDKSSRTLSLFRRPSARVAMLRFGATGAAIFAFASDESG
jgi:hypothetical protein